MEANYGIGVNNRYALLGEDGDPLDPSLALPPKPQQPTAAKPLGKENKGTSSGTTATVKKATPVQAPAGKGPTNLKAPSAAPANTKTGDRPQGQGNRPERGPRPDRRERPPGSGKSSFRPAGPPTAATTTHNAGQGSQASQAGSKKRGFSDRVNSSNSHERSSDTRPPRTPRDGPRPDRPPRDGPRPDRPPRDFARPPRTEGTANGQANFEERKNRRNREDRGPLQQTNAFTDRPMTDSGKLDERSKPARFPRGDRPPREGQRSEGRRRIDNRDGRGKPVYDRHSGSDKAGIKPVDKRDGAGAHNWGTVTDELEGQTAAGEGQLQPVEENADNAAGNTSGQSDTEAGKEVSATEEETGPKEMTLEEYKRLQKKEAPKSKPKFNLRKPGEGEDDSKWKKTFLLEKKKEVDEEEEEYEEIEVVEEIKPAKKKIIEIDINFNDSFRDDRRGGRGGHRGGRGGFDRGDRPPRDRDDRDRGDRPPRGEGPPRGPKRGPGAGGFGRKQTAPRVDDVNDFPSLGVAA